MKRWIRLEGASLTVCLVTFLLCTLTAAASERSLDLNCSDRYWYPFLYTQSNQVKGILYEMVSKAFENLNIKANIIPVPFKRAIVNAEKGKVDGVIAVGYRPDLSQVMDFPPEADRDMESPWRILQIDHVVVSMADQSYVFEGDPKTLPEPVRLLQDAPLITDLNKLGIKAQEVREDEQNFLKLIRDETGVIITTSVAAEMMYRDNRFKGKIKIHAIPVASHSYFLIFSKKSQISIDEKMIIWREIKSLRDDYIFMLQIFSQY